MEQLNQISATNKQPSLLQALLPIFFIVGLLILNVAIYGDDTLSGSNQIALLLGAAFTGVIGHKLGYKWKTMLDAMVNSVGSAMSAVIILLLIGALAGTWLVSGIVPSMVYYGLKILNPSIFLFAACVVCALVSIATGSSWSTIATVGVALLGVGEVMGYSKGLIAGAVISGAYFGDKMSPMSDTTNLAPAMAGTDLITHIRYMTYTTLPSIGIALLLYLGIGFFYSADADSVKIDEMLVALESSINITPWVFLVPLAVILLIVKKVPAIPSLLIGTLLGAIFAIIFQPGIMATLGAAPEGTTGFVTTDFAIYYKAAINSMTIDTSITTSNDALNDLLSTGGMSGMMGTIWLVICAMLFGGIMEVCGFLKRIANALLYFANSVGGLIATTTGTCVLFNLTASDQYLAIVVPGKMYADVYKEKGLAPENLSRTLEDSGTVTSVLVPWNTCGAAQAGVLGVATLVYLPFCFFNIISPIMTMIYGFVGIKIKKLPENTSENQLTEGI